jgi:glycosyltransferase involved in cell wall biosynthesis
MNVLEALTRFPADKFEIVAAYVGAHWEDVLRSLHRTGVPVPIGAGTEFLVKCVRFGALPLPVWSSIVAHLNPAARTLARLGCDLWIYPAQDDWSYLGPRPAMATIHDLMHRYEPSFPEVSAGNKFARRERHYKRICAAADAILVDSETGKQHVVESYGTDRDRVFPLPFIAPQYLLDNGEAASALPASVPSKFFFYPAQFWMHKNHERLLHALAHAKRRANDIALVLVGSKKNNYERVRILVQDLGLTDNVSLLGYVDNRLMGSLYRHARALVMPTFFGPTNIPPLEAFACGCPVAVSDIYGMREQVGDAALLFDPRSVAQMADVLERLWRDDALCLDLARRGRETAAVWGRSEFAMRLLQIVEEQLRRPTSHYSSTDRRYARAGHS